MQVTTMLSWIHSPQYAVFLPKYFPRYGTSSIVSSSSICCRLSRHSRSASEYASSSLGETDVVEPAEDDGRESTSSLEEGGGISA